MFGSLFGLWEDSENGALAHTRAQSRRSEGSEIKHISVFFEDLFQNLNKRCPRCHFLLFFCKKGPKGVPKGSPNPSKVEKKWCPEFMRFPFGCQILPRRGPGVQKVAKSDRKSMILWCVFFRMSVSDCFENVDSWQLLSYALACTLCLLCSSAVNCIVVISGFFVACELSSLAPYPSVSQESGVYIARRFPVPLPLQVYISLEEGPPIWRSLGSPVLALC